MESKLVHEVDYMKLLFENKHISIYELDALYLGENPNGMYIDKECVIRSLSSFADMPLYCVIDNKWNPLDSIHNDFLEHFREKCPDRITRDRILPFGCVPESAIKDAKFIERDGHTYLRMNVVVWKTLLPHVSDILQRRDGSVKISVEFYIEEAVQDEASGLLNVLRFEIGAITALGENFKEIMEGSKLKSVKFSYEDYVKNTDNEYFSFSKQDYKEIPSDVLSTMKDGLSMREKYGRGGSKSVYNSISTIAEIGIMYDSQIEDAKSYFSTIDVAPVSENPPTGKSIVYSMFGGDSGREWLKLVCNSDSVTINKNGKEGGSLVDKIVIDNKKESAIDSGSWSNPEKSLYEPLLNSENSDVLVEEAYLIVEDGYKEAPSEKLKYPHHEVREGKLVLNVAGVKSAFARASQMGIVDGDVKKHLERHYEELGLSAENFAAKCAELEESFASLKEEMDAEREKFANISIEHASACAEKDALLERCSELEEKFSSKENDFNDVSEKLSAYIRKEEIASNMAMIGEYCSCFDEAKVEELSKCAETMSSDEMKEKMASEVMGFAKGYCSENVNTKESDKFAQFSVNPFFINNPSKPAVNVSSVLSNITKKSKTKVV